MYEKPILVVDDQQDLLIMIRKIFERAGFTQIMTAASAEEALNLLSAKMPAMAVLDVMMPGMDGFALLKEIRKVSSMPVLMLTAKGEPEDRCTGLELGADDYLVKPFLPRELLLRVTAILKRAYPEGNRIVTLAASQVDLDKAEVRKGKESLSAYCKGIRRISEACRKCRPDRYYWFSLPDCLRRDLAGL